MSRHRIPSAEIIAAHSHTQLLQAVPESHVLAMIEQCAERVTQAETIPDAKQSVTVAEAIAAVSRKIAASQQTKAAAVRLLVGAERRLGEILRTIPVGMGFQTRAPGYKRKGEILKQYGIDKRRASVAERLAATPAGEIDKVLGDGARTLHGVVTSLGLHQNGAAIRANRHEEMRMIAEDAIAMLEECLLGDRRPARGPVVGLRTRFRNLTAKGGAS